MGSRKLKMEALEDRRMLATFVVNNLGDLGVEGETLPGTLRRAVELANANGAGNDTIVFEDFLFSDFGGTSPIFLETFEDLGGQITITSSLEILGPSASLLEVIAAPGNNRIFDIPEDGDNAINVTIGGMTLSGGDVFGQDEDSRGGAIRNFESLTLLETIVTGNSASNGGGGIFHDLGSLTIERSLIQNNSAGGGGGGIHSGTGDEDSTPLLNIQNSTITGNSTFSIEEAPGFGGGVFTHSGTTYIGSSTIIDNNAAAGGGVASYGLPVDSDDALPIITIVSNSILLENTRSGGFEDDIYGVRANIDGDPLVPEIEITDHNVIGAIFGAVFNPETGNFYQIVYAPEGITWDEAFLAAGGNGSIHLATPSTSNENEFIFDNLLDGNPAAWNAFFVEEEGAPYDMTTINVGPWLGATQTVTDPEMDEPGMGWEWITEPDPLDPDRLDEPFDTFNNWETSEPDNGENIFGPDDPPDENRLAYLTDDFTVFESTWGDLPSDSTLPVAFIIEYESGDSFFALDPTTTPYLISTEFDDGGMITYTPIFGDFGGTTPTYMPNAALLNNPLIDGGNEDISGGFEQRGRLFTRVYDGDNDSTAIIDIGATEAQAGNWVVDSLEDELDGQYSAIWDDDQLGQPVVYSQFFNFGSSFTIDPYLNTLGNIVSQQESSIPPVVSSRGNDFTLREAIDLARKNPTEGLAERSTISFDTNLLRVTDPSPFTPPPTIDLDAPAGLLIDVPLIINGPTSFILEVDASNSGGTRVFKIDDGISGVYANNIDVDINNLTITGGNIGYDGAIGGGILNLENLTITGSTITGNQAGLTGGGIHTGYLARLTIRNSAIVNNNAGTTGGGIYTDPDTFENLISNSTISGNVAGSLGGGINNRSEYYTTRIEYSTITNNTANAFLGSGVLNQGGLLEVTHTIISGNVNQDIDQFGGTVTSLGYNLVGDGGGTAPFSAATNDLVGAAFKDPKLKALTLGGGITPTHEPLADSPVINAGDSSLQEGVGGVPRIDQRDFVAFDDADPDINQNIIFRRIYDEDEDPMTPDIIDIGAYELQGVVYKVDNPIDEDDGNYSAGDLSLREAILLSNATPKRDTIDLSEIQGFTSSITGTGLLGDLNDMVITDSVSFDGFNVTLQGASGTRIFTVDDGNNTEEINVLMRNFTAIDNVNFGDRGTGVPVAADDGIGGVFYNKENLTLLGWTFINNSTFDPGLQPGDPGYVAGAQFHGGAIAHELGDLVIEDSTFANNDTNGVNAHGGAIYAVGGDVTILRSTLATNSTTQSNSDGGAIYFRNGILTIGDTIDNDELTIISANTVEGGSSQGAGIFLYQGAGEQTIATIEEAIISSNSTIAAFSTGTGIYNHESTLTINDSTISGNNSVGSLSGGAGIYQNGGLLTLNKTLLSQNSTTGTYSHGAGLTNNGGDVYINQSRIVANTTSAESVHGAGIYNIMGNLEVRDSSIENNLTSGDSTKGAGIYSLTDLSNYTTTIHNSTVSGNSAQYSGGGLYNAGGLTDIRHSTFVNNNVADYGFGAGAASKGNSATTRTDVHASIIAGNLTSVPLEADFTDSGDVNGADFLTLFRNFGNVNASKSEGDANDDQMVDSADLDVLMSGFGLEPVASDVDRIGAPFEETFNSLDYNVIGVGLSSSAFNGANDQTGVLDPMLGPLQNNGGDTFTHLPMLGSPVIDAGPVAFNENDFTPPLSEDQRGEDRVSGGVIDVGAVEVQQFSLAAATFQVTSEPRLSALSTTSTETARVESSRTNDDTSEGLRSNAWLSMPKAWVSKGLNKIKHVDSYFEVAENRIVQLQDVAPADLSDDLTEIATSRKLKDVAYDYELEDLFFNHFGLDQS